MSCTTDAIEVRLSAYAIPCLTCQAFASAGAMIIDGKAILRGGVAHAISDDGRVLCEAHFPAMGVVA